jgi:hypothetical protein
MEQLLIKIPLLALSQIEYLLSDFVDEVLLLSFFMPFSRFSGVIWV